MIPVKTQFASNYSIRYLIGIIKEKYATWKALARKQDKLSQSQLDAINILSSSGTLDTSRIPNLDASKITTGVIDIDRLPQGALERLVTVANQTARFALTSTDVQLGDTVKQTDTGMMYIVTDTANLANDNGYTEYTAGSATSVPWSGVTGKPAFANVATSGSYNDLTDKPTIPTVPTNYVTTDTTQTVSGQKTWTDIQTYNEMAVYSHSSDVVEQSRQKLPKDVSTSTDPMARFSTLVDSAGHNVVVTAEGHWETYVSKSVSLKYKNDSTKAGTVDFRLGSNGKGIFYPQSPFECSLGNSANQWSSVYAQTYYYNGTEFQNKFVTVDTNQTISGNKTFTGINAFTSPVHAVTSQSVPITENPSAEIVGNNFRFIDNDRFWGQFVPVWGTDGSFRIELGISNWTTAGGQGYWALSTQISKDFGTLSFYTSHLNANLGTPSNNWNTVWTQSVRAPGTSNSLLLAAMETWEDGARIFMYGKDHTEGCHIYADIDHNDGNHNKTGVRLDSRGFLPTGVSRNLGIADANYKWATLNGINPGALSIPNMSSSSRLDISGDMVPDSYGNIVFTPPIYGWVYIDFNVASATITSGTVMLAQVKDNNLANSSFAVTFARVEGSDHVLVWTPVWANKLLIIEVNFSGFSVGKAYIYPCLGNV